MFDGIDTHIDVHVTETGKISDIHYLGIYDVKDHDIIKKKFQLVNSEYLNNPDNPNVEKLNELNKELEGKITRKFEGQYIQDTSNSPAPIDAVVNYDILTNDGLFMICSRFIGSSTITPPTHMAAGDGTAIATQGDLRLQNERARISMITDGFRTAAGTTMRYGAVFLPTFPSFIIAESGAVNAATGGRFLDRTTFPSPRRVHTTNLDFFTISVTVALTAL